MRIFWPLCLLLFSFSLSAQEAYQEDKIYTPSQLKQDLDILASSLEAYHPALYEFTEKQDFEAHIQNTKASMKEGLTEEQFHVQVRKLVKEIGCGHTTAVPSSAWYLHQKSSQKSIPLSVYILEDKIYIKNYPEDSLRSLAGAEISSINDRASRKILAEMRSIQQRDGYTTSLVDPSVARLFSTYHLFLYGQSEVYKLKYIDLEGKEGTIVLKAGAKIKAAKDNRKIAYKGNGMQLLLDETHSDLAILDLNSFASKGYKKNYKHIFQELESKQIKHLVIDLRDNGGGYFLNGNTLLRYLLPHKFQMKFRRPKGKPAKSKNVKLPFGSKLTTMLFNVMPDKDNSDPMRNYSFAYKPMKKNHFDGEVYVLTNGRTFSMGSLVTTRLKHDRKSMIIGSETGGGESGSYAIINHHLYLPNTGVHIYIPYYFLDHDVTPEEKGRGVIPDIIVNQKIKDLTSGKDEELEIVRSKIK